MEDFPILLIMLIVYLIAAASGGKKKQKKQRRGPMRPAAQTETRDTHARTRAGQTAQGFSTAFERMQSVPVPEGEDVCHPRREQDSAQDAGQEPLQEMEAYAPAQDVLRGVIMSEILTRPSERRARNRRGYHG